MTVLVAFASRQSKKSWSVGRMHFYPARGMPRKVAGARRTNASRNTACVVLSFCASCLSISPIPTYHLLCGSFIVFISRFASIKVPSVTVGAVAGTATTNPWRTTKKRRTVPLSSKSTSRILHERLLRRKREKSPCHLTTCHTMRHSSRWCRFDPEAWKSEHVSEPAKSCAAKFIWKDAIDFPPYCLSSSSNNENHSSQFTCAH